MWAEYHGKALELGKQAHAARQGGDGAKAEALSSEALLQSSYGDHFLQDSFSAGHLINKTLIMQWFVKWLDAHPDKWDMTTNANWRSAQNMAYGQEGLAARDLYKKKVGATKAIDPQAADNTKGAWTDRFAAAGLRVPAWMSDPGSATYQVFRWWQHAVTRSPPAPSRPAGPRPTSTPGSPARRPPTRTASRSTSPTGTASSASSGSTATRSPSPTPPPSSARGTLTGGADMGAVSKDNPHPSEAADRQPWVVPAAGLEPALRWP